jgi:hypothetical protein
VAWSLQHGLDYSRARGGSEAPALAIVRCATLTAAAIARATPRITLVIALTTRLITRSPRRITLTATRVALVCTLITWFTTRSPRHITLTAAAVTLTTTRVAPVYILVFLRILRNTWRILPLTAATVTRTALSVTILMPVLLTILPAAHAHTLAVILTVIVAGTGAITPARPAAAAGAISGIIP